MYQICVGAVLLSLVTPLWAQSPPCQVDFEFESVPGGASSNFAIADFDGDSDLDLVVAGDGVTVWFNDGSGQDWTLAQELPDATSHILKVGDIDGDGDMDLVAGSTTLGFLIYSNDGNGEFALIGVQLGIVAEKLADVNGDGYLDGVGVGVSGLLVSYWDPLMGLFGAPLPVASLSNPLIRFEIEDIGGDSSVDAIVARSDPEPQIVLFEGDGAVFEQVGTVVVPELIASIALPDLNGDGVLDLVVSGVIGGVWIAYGLGDFQFGPWDFFEMDLLLPVGIGAADIDQDGSLDLLFGVGFIDREAAIAVLLSDGMGGFSTVYIPVPETSSSHLSVGDIDGDGADDIVTAEFLGRNRTVDFLDCNGNGIADGCDIESGSAIDCDGNGRPDACDIADGVLEDSNGDGIPDLCSRFVRGDVNGDLAVELVDAIVLLGQLFSGTPIPCPDASDADDDGTLTLVDAVFLLQALFSSGAAPAEPSAACGVDPTPDALDCVALSGCSI